LIKTVVFEKSQLEFEEWEVRKKFIEETESGIYDGVNVDGEKVLVFLEKNQGMLVKTIKASKPKWYEVIEYDEEGYTVGVMYEPVE